MPLIAPLLHCIMRARTIDPDFHHKQHEGKENTGLRSFMPCVDTCPGTRHACFVAIRQTTPVPVANESVR